MPFHSITLNDGRKIPQIGFGTWKIPQEVTAAQVDQAVEVGFDHIDTAQVYRNEEQVGQAIKEAGLARKDLWVTTKWSGVDDKGAQQSINESLEKLGLDYVDLYLIHHPRVTKGDIKGAWKEMEDIQKQGKAKSIGVSNFSVDDLKELLKHATVKPVVNQILLHPYVIGTQQPLLDYMHEQHIVPEGYSTLIPITSKPGGPVDKPVDKLAKKYKVQPEQILLAWSKAKHAIIVSTSSRKDRLERYLAVGDLDLTHDEVKEIDHAGRKGQEAEERKAKAKEVLKYGSVVVLAAYAGYRTFF